MLNLNTLVNYYIPKMILSEDGLIAYITKYILCFYSCKVYYFTIINALG